MFVPNFSYPIFVKCLEKIFLKVVDIKLKFIFFFFFKQRLISYNSVIFCQFYHVCLMGMCFIGGFSLCLFCYMFRQSSQCNLLNLSQNLDTVTSAVFSASTEVK